MDDVTIAAYLDHQLHGAARERFESHIAQCADCRRAVIDAEELLKSMRARRGRRGLTILAAAMAVVLVVRLSGFNADRGQRLRGSAVSTELAGYAPTGNVSTRPIRFVWSPLAGAISYKLELTDGDARMVWTASTADTLMALPTSVALQSGTNYFWRVDAIAADGTMRSTATHEFRPMD